MLSLCLIEVVYSDFHIKPIQFKKLVFELRLVCDNDKYWWKAVG